jgi:two-component system NtrC family sensor kinase
MRRRSSASGKPIKTRRRSTVTLKRSNAPKVGGRRKPSSTNADTKNALLERERDELLEQQKATAEVLRVISSSPGELEPVFQAMLENAVRICEAKFGTLYLRAGDAFRAAALHNAPPAFVEFWQRGPHRPGPSTVLSRVLRTKEVVHISDITADQAYTERDPLFIAAAELGGFRTVLAVPMLKETDVLGAIYIYRQEVRPFSDKQIALLASFASQAVIAIENTRLLNELRESLQQQTATADVLKVISSSPGELEPVFQAMLENATRICHAKFGVLQVYEGRAFRIGAIHNAPPAFAEAMARRELLMRPTPQHPFTRMVTTKEVVQIADLTDSPAYKERDYGVVMLVELASARTFLAVPMLKENEVVGVIAIYRQEVLTFTDKQIELVKNFAAQAVIAIENTRLLNELRQRTTDLTESLEQQTATSEVLGVISSSPGELEPVFAAMLRNAVQLCDAKFGNIYRWDGEALRLVAGHNTPTALAEARRHTPLRPAIDSLIGRMIATKTAIHVDAATHQGYLDRSDPGAITAVELGGVRSVLVVPMLKEDELIGSFTVYRQEPRPFTEKQIALVTNFAAQAVIAIENTRLLNELRESLEQQTATAEVLRVISSSPGQLEPVFDAMLENAVRICEAHSGTLVLREDDGFRVVALHGAPAAFSEARSRQLIIRFEPGHHINRLVQTKGVVHIPDLVAEPAAAPQLAKFAGARTLLSVPMLKDNEVVGAFGIYRQEVRPFTDKQIAVIESFAAQAVIAIENTRLLNELRQRTDDLSKSLDDLRTAQDRLVQTQKLASLGQLTAGIAHEIKNPLNFVNNFSGVSVELIDELQDALRDAPLTEKARAEINELSGTLRDNLDKIVQHGKRADSIVKNMLLHSREGSGERRPVDVNALVEESLSLAYHGARAETQGFNVTLERSLDPTAGEVDVFPQEITRVLLNLISNGFYAANKRQGQESGNGFEPTITAATKSLGDRVEIRIRDNGIGIPPEVREKMFNPFFTTKPAGEGTGLGLSISHDIIVKQHLGSIEVDTEPGLFTEFRIILPRSAA